MNFMTEIHPLVLDLDARMATLTAESGRLRQENAALMAELQAHRRG